MARAIRWLGNRPFPAAQAAQSRRAADEQRSRVRQGAQGTSAAGEHGRPPEVRWVVLAPRAGATGTALRSPQAMVTDAAVRAAQERADSLARAPRERMDSVAGSVRAVLCLTFVVGIPNGAAAR